jgi:dihydrofolate reductase
MKTYALVVAHDEKLGIGKDNRLPWHIKGDMKYFRDLTTNLSSNNESDSQTKNVVIMGRRTWESLPNNYKPLPNRINVVISRNSNYTFPADVLHSKSIEEALNILKQKNYGNIFVIGGAAIYETVIKMNIFNTLYVTEIEGKYNCDVFFPEYRNIFELIESSALIVEGDHRFFFKTFKRKA